MENNNVCIFVGSEITALLLKAHLEENGILSMLKNEFQSGLMAGFGQGLPLSVDLYIKIADVSKAQQLIEEFNQ